MKAAEQGDAEAQSTLGLMYAKGQGVAQDHGKAHAWFLKGAEQGFAQAQFSLGIMYANGAGGDQDFVKARAWLLKAAEQGHALGQLSVGIMYRNGEGGRKDYVQSYRWFALSIEQAAELRDPLANHIVRRATTLRVSVAKKMTPSQLDEAKRLIAEWKRTNAKRDGATSE